MILDYLREWSFAWMFDILDRETGEDLNRLRIVYADDEEGVIRRRPLDARGLPVLDREQGEPELAAPIEERRAIRIVPKAGYERPAEQALRMRRNRRHA